MTLSTEESSAKSLEHTFITFLLSALESELIGQWQSGLMEVI
jgi:hypothetical protein